MNSQDQNNPDLSILSILLKNQSEMAEHAALIQGSIIDDIDDDSHPRLKLLETILNWLQPSFEKNNRHYQYALQQVKLSELRSLLEASEKVDDRTSFISNIKEVQKINNEISFRIDFSVKHTNKNLSWLENVEVDVGLEFNQLKQGQKEILSKLGNSPTIGDIIPILNKAGLKAVSFTVKSIRLKKNILTINDFQNIEFSCSIQSDFINLFFNKRGNPINKPLDFMDIFDKLESTSHLLSTKEGKAKLKHKYYEAKRNINAKIKSETNLKPDFIICKNSTFFINPDILK